jgi:protein-L-isoaspartate(D-aspartate) O-methyltransferase
MLERDFTVLRERMVKDQLLARGIHDENVLKAMRRVLRHEFLPEPSRRLAYTDGPVPIAEGQTISQPYIVALMTQELALSPENRVLEIGTGSGYQTAVLAEIAAHVDTVERRESLSRNAQNILAKLHYENITFYVGDESACLKDPQKKFDAIMVTAAMPDTPMHLIERLKEGGRFVVPIGARESQMLTLFVKGREGLQSRSLCPCMFVPLIGRHGFSGKI